MEKVNVLRVKEEIAASAYGSLRDFFSQEAGRLGQLLENSQTARAFDVSDSLIYQFNGARSYSLILAATCGRETARNISVRFSPTERQEIPEMVKIFENALFVAGFDSEYGFEEARKKSLK